MLTSRVPIRWRLTIWYTLLLAAALVMFAVGIFFGLRRSLYAGLDDTLQSQAALIATAIEVDAGVPYIDLASVSNPKEGEQFIRLTDREGRIIADSSAQDAAPLNRAGLEVALAGRADLRWSTIDGERMRVLSEPIRADNLIIGALQIGQQDEQIVEALETTTGLIALLIPMVLVLAVAMGIWLARRALVPLERIANLASAIEAHDLSRRIDLVLPRDEVGRVAQTFNAMLDRIESAFQRQRRFTADASHELRTPLALMQSQIELALISSRNPADDTRVFETLADDVDRLARISSALLALARGDAGEIRLEYADVDVLQLLELMASHYAPSAQAKGIEIVVDASPVHVVADEDRLIQVLGNLLDNAVRYTSTGGRIALGCGGNGDMVRIWVSDTGIGIDAEHLPHIGERFYRVHHAESAGGAGLGLSISRMLIEAHRGGLSIASRPGVGTTVTVELPAHGH